MFSLVITKRKESNVIVKLFQTREELEREMITMYNIGIKKAEKIDWRYTYFDNDKWYGSVDDWNDRTEYRCCKVN